MSAPSFPPAILRPHELPSRSRGGGASTIPLVTKAIGAEIFLNGITIFEPGASIPLHTHNCPESVMVIEGNAFVQIAGEETALSRYDTTFVDAGIEHRFRNASDTEPMRIFWTYASVEATRTIVATGETNRVDAESGVPQAD